MSSQCVHTVLVYVSLQQSSAAFHCNTQYNFSCSHCGYGCNTSKALKIHTTREHCSNSTISPKLDKLFVMANPPPNPMATVPPNPDPISDTIPTSLPSLQDTLSPQFKCKKCGKLFVNSFSLKDHMWFRHGVEGT